MKKMLVETTGDFMLVDYSAEATEIASGRPSVVFNTRFVQSRISAGQIKHLADVSDEATDEAFVETLANSKDATVAVEAFKAEFDPKPVTAKRTAPAK